MLLKGYDSMMQKALYEDTLNFYLTALINITINAMRSEVDFIKNPEFVELLFKISLCNKLGYPESVAKDIIKYMAQLFTDRDKKLTIIEFMDMVFKEMSKNVKQFTKFYKPENDQYYITNAIRAGMEPSWSDVYGPIVWTWCHLSFANTTNLAHKQQNTAVIAILDAYLGCSICSTHYKQKKNIMFSELSDLFIKYDSEEIMLHVHSYVTLDIKISRLYPPNEERTLGAVAVWRSLRNQIANEFRDQYRNLEINLHKHKQQK